MKIPAYRRKKQNNKEKPGKLKTNPDRVRRRKKRRKKRKNGGGGGLVRG